MLGPVAAHWIAPLAGQWVWHWERHASLHGIPLGADGMRDAVAAGVREPGKVRLLKVDRIELFATPALQLLNAIFSSAFSTTSGITLGYAILIRSTRETRRLLVHELAHVAQYERAGGITPFLRMYLRECFVEGYPNGPLEQEAIETAARIAGV